MRAGSSSASQVGELVLADLQLVAVLQPVRLDPRAVHVCAVERTAVVEVPVVAAAHEQGVVARDGHVVEEHVAVGPTADRQALAVHRKALAGAAPAGADDECGTARDHLFELDGLDLAGLADPVRGRRLMTGPLGDGQVRTALLAVLGSDGIREAAFGAMERHGILRWAVSPPATPRPASGRGPRGC